jgi:hypothetical protein
MLTGYGGELLKKFSPNNHELFLESRRKKSVLTRITYAVSKILDIIAITRAGHAKVKTPIDGQIITVRIINPVCVPIKNAIIVGVRRVHIAATPAFSTWALAHPLSIYF